MTVRVAVTLFDPLNAAVITTDACEVTERDVIVKVAEVEFARTVTLAGTVAAEVLLLVSVTSLPPAGANPLRVTVPVEVAPLPATVVGFKVKDVRPVAAGFTVSVA